MNMTIVNSIPMKQILLKSLLIALYCFLFKTVLEIFIEWTNILPLHVHAHTWGKFRRSVSYVLLDFAFYFWIYIVVTISFYVLVSYVKKVKSWIWYVIVTVFVFVILLFQHNFQFPTKNYYLPSTQEINYKLIEQFIVYTCATYMMISLVIAHQKATRLSIDQENFKRKITN